MYPVNRRAPTNIRQPEYTGVCERTGFYGKHANLAFQWEWAGPGMVNKNILVLTEFLDLPNEQLRTIRIGPDGLPPKPRPSPTNYAQQNAAPGYTAPLGPLVDDYTGQPIIGDYTQQPLTVDTAPSSTALPLPDAPPLPPVVS